MTQFNGRTKICYGENAINNLEKLTGRHAFIVTDPFMVKMGFTDRVISGLERANITQSVFDKVEPDPSLETVQKGTVKLLADGADLVIALGGGLCHRRRQGDDVLRLQGRPVQGQAPAGGDSYHQRHRLRGNGCDRCHRHRGADEDSPD